MKGPDEAACQRAMRQRHPLWALAIVNVTNNTSAALRVQIQGSERGNVGFGSLVRHFDDIQSIRDHSLVQFQHDLLEHDRRDLRRPAAGSRHRHRP